jgi:dTDP-4-amino-4,6-dideoxygalactose transaminase
VVANTIGLNSVIEDLEKKVAHYAGTRYAVICSSGRSAIRFSLLALGIKRGCEVVIPNLSCQILPITVFCTGATPRFCDIERSTIALSPAYLLKVLNRNTKAVILVHPYGIPVDPAPFLEITQERGIALVEDVAQALGAEIKGKKVGSFGDVGIFTFNKFLNVNSGAAVVTDSHEIADKMKLVRQTLETKSYFASICYRMLKFFGLESKKLIKSVFWGDNCLYQLLRVKFAKKRFRIVDGWVEVGPYLDEIRRSKVLTNALMAYSGIQKNYTRRKLETLEISVLTSEFENLEKRLQKRRRSAKFYEDNLKEECFSKLTVPEHSVPSYLRYPILFSDERKRSVCINNLFKLGYAIDYTYEPLHTSPFFNLENRYSVLSESIYLSKHLLPLPVHPSLSQRDVERITSVVNSSAKM